MLVCAFSRSVFSAMVGGPAEAGHYVRRRLVTIVRSVGLWATADLASFAAVHSEPDSDARSWAPSRADVSLHKSLVPMLVAEPTIAVTDRVGTVPVGGVE